MINDLHRKNMIARLRDRGITDERVLQAMAKIPRHKFVPAGIEFQAYDEKALPIGHGQTISHPYTVAVMTQLLDVSRSKRILEIGTGSGYQAAVLCELGARLFTVEVEKALCERANKILKHFNYMFVINCGDGSGGWPAYAPYDGIIVTAGAPVIPEDLKKQLADGGILVIPVGDRDNQQLTVIRRSGDEYFSVTIEDLKFVPLVGKRGWTK
jgi:protein-L-isoaspartate(D-aspartate) O-methyltransferase